MSDDLKNPEFVEYRGQQVKLTELMDDYRNMRNKLAQSKSENRSSVCLLYTSPSPRDRTRSRMPSSA